MKKLLMLFIMSMFLVSLVSALDVTLNSPANNSQITNPSQDFNFTAGVVGSTIKNATLWIGNSSSWQNVSTIYVGNATQEATYTCTGTSCSNAKDNDNSTSTSLSPGQYIEFDFGKDIYISTIFSKIFSYTAGTMNLSLATNSSGYTQVWVRSHDEPAVNNYTVINGNYRKVKLACQGSQACSVYETTIFSITSTANLTKIISYTFTQPGDYKWNVESCAQDNSCSFATNNYTLTMVNGLGLCGANYTYPMLNITFKDESTLNNIGATIPTSTFNYSQDNYATSNELSYTNTTGNNNYTFCSAFQGNLTIDPYVQYANTSYPQRIWNPSAQSYNTTNVAQQVLYLLSSSDGIYVTFQVINPSNQVISGVDVTAVREISGTDIAVATGTTGADGSVTFWLNPDFSHDFTFSKTGFTSLSTSFTPTQTSYTVTLGGSSSTQVDDYSRGITKTILPKANSILYNDTIYNFNFTLASSYWDITEMGFTLSLSNGTTLATQSQTSVGTISQNINVSNNSQVTMKYYWLINGTYSNQSISWIVINSDNTNWSIKNFFNRLNSYLAVGFFGIDEFGRYLIIFLILFISIGIMSYKYGLTSPLPLAAMIFSIVFFFDVAVNLIPSPPGAITHFPTFLAGLLLVVIIIKEATR